MRAKRMPEDVLIEVARTLCRECSRLQAENAQLRLQNERFRADIDRLNAENDRIVADRAAAIRDQGHALDLYSHAKSQLAATEQALQEVQRENAELREKYHALKKVADAAYAWRQGLQSLDMLEVEIRAYRANLVTLSPSKQAVIDAALERLTQMEGRRADD